MVNLYTVLGVRERATDDEIDAAWRNITRKPNSAAGEGTQDEPPGSKCNLYTILGVRQDATHAEFSNTYRDITQPPDGVIDERTRDGKLLEIALETLTDREARRIYDDKIRNNPKERGRDSDLLIKAKNTLWDRKSRTAYDTKMWNTERKYQHRAKDDASEKRGALNGNFKTRQLRAWNENKSKVGR
ncbi:MAG: hypothetical protein L6R38_001884 [Xanthoria sp. 2 TBL-2021]|nr:MAG: hypothetical protein L6R38_001884 [Xanthoria sp. 2 TBL-2021]